MVCPGTPSGFTPSLSSSLRHLGCNKWLVHRNVFLIILEAEKFKVKVSSAHCVGRTPFS